MFVRGRTAGRHRDCQRRAAALGRGLCTLPQSCLLQTGCLAQPHVPLAQWGVPVPPSVAIHPGQLRSPSCVGSGSASTSPSPAACSSILDGPLSSGTQSVPKGGRELGMGGTGMGILG